jgi:hypothetical protein
MSIAYCLSFGAAGLRNRFNNTITPNRTASTTKIIAMPRPTIIKASIKSHLQWEIIIPIVLQRRKEGAFKRGVSPSFNSFPPLLLGEGEKGGVKRKLSFFCC